MYNIARRLAGLHHDDDLDIEQDVSAAMQLYQRCIDEHGNINAMFDLALMLEDGVRRAESIPFAPVTMLIEEDPNTAFNLYQRCVIEANHVDAALRLTDLSSSGRLQFKQSFPRVVDIYENAITAANSLSAKYELARILSTGAQGVARDVPYAVRLYKDYLVDLDVEHAEALSPTDAKKALSSMMQLAELLVTRVYSMQIDVNLAVDLCKMFIARNGNCEVVVKLAGNVASGSSGLVKDKLLAVRMYELCVQERNDLYAGVALAGILISEVAEVHRDINRAMQLCKTAVDGRCGGIVTKLARKIANSSTDIRKDVPLAIRICEMSIHRENEASALLTLVELLLCKPANERDVGRAVRVFKKYISHPDTNYGAVGWLVRKIMDGTGDLVKDGPVAAQLCEICIDKTNNLGATITLAELLVSGVSGIERDTDRAVRLCRIYNSQASLLCGVPRLARKIANGTSGIVRDASLAVQLCELSLNGNRVDAVMVLAELLVSGRSNVERDADRVVREFRNYRKYRSSRTDNVKLLELARNIAHGASDMLQDVPLAISLCHVCLDITDSLGVVDIHALIVLSEVLLIEVGGAATNASLAAVFCQVCTLNKKYHDKMVELARKVARGTAGVARNTALAVRLCEMCVDVNETADTLFGLVEALLLGTRSIRNINRAKKVCKQLITKFKCDKVVELARNIWSGSGGMKKDATLAVQLCELCVNEMHDQGAMIALAQFLVSGDAGITRDVERVVNLCKMYIVENLYSDGVEDIARMVGVGTAEIGKDARLGVQLLELCIKERKSCRAMYYLAEILSFGGCGVEIDEVRATELRKAAADGGFEGDVRIDDGAVEDDVSSEDLEDWWWEQFVTTKRYLDIDGVWVVL